MNIVETQIVHYPSGTEVSLFSLVKEKIEEKDLERIAFICDQELIYNRLFRERLKDRRYEKKMRWVLWSGQLRVGKRKNILYF